MCEIYRMLFILIIKYFNVNFNLSESNIKPHDFLTSSLTICKIKTMKKIIKAKTLEIFEYIYLYGQVGA